MKEQTPPTDSAQKTIDQEIKQSVSDSADVAKSHGEILREQLIEGMETFDAHRRSVFISSFTAGMEIGFSYLLMGTIFSFFSNDFSEGTLFKLISLAYPLGFILVVFGQSVLFTEQTSLLSLPVFNKKRSVKSLLGLWGTVIAGNLVGGYIISLVFLWICPKLGLFEHDTVSIVANHVISFSPLVILVSAILAGWLMGLLSWLVTSSRDTITRFVIIFMITATMSFTGLHHSIIGSIEVFSGMITSADIGFVDYLTFQVLALIGNAIGGVVFVALFKYRAFVTNVDLYSD